jgi:hypothetical protein
VWGPSSFTHELESEDFSTEYYPLKRPKNAPLMDFKGTLLHPFHPYHEDLE